MPENFLAVAVQIPPKLNKDILDFARAKEFSSRSAVIVRSIEFYLQTYSPKRNKPLSPEYLAVRKRLKKIINTKMRCEK